MVTEIIGFSGFTRMMSGEQQLRLFHDLISRFDSQQRPAVSTRSAYLVIATSRLVVCR